jgi:DNA-binding NarL/FixJ family response regulator
MTGRITQPWFPSDDERLRKLAAEGRTSTTIAERMKRSPDSVRKRAKKLKIVLRRLEINRRFGWGSLSQD